MSIRNFLHKISFGGSVVFSSLLVCGMSEKFNIKLLCVSGGLHHAAVRIAGDNVYRYLKHEGGTHRVQRIPEVGLSSRMQRIHTGTMTVIVLPQPVEVHSTFVSLPPAFSSVCVY